MDANATVIPDGMPGTRPATSGRTTRTTGTFFFRVIPFSGLSVLEDPRTLPDGRAEGGSPPNYFNKTRDMLESAWNEFVPFLEFPVELRKIVYPTNSIESLNARFRRAVRHRGHFPTEQAAMKVLYLVAIARQRIGRT